MSRKIKYLCIHCTATKEGSSYTGRQVRGWHKDKGWKVVGYHWYIDLKGYVDNLHPVDGDNLIQTNEIVNGCWGLNSKSLHVCYCGGVDADGKPKDTRTQSQRESLEIVVKGMIRRYPHIKVLGHNQAIYPGRTPKACPSFNVPDWLERIGVSEDNIERRANIFTDE